MTSAPHVVVVGSCNLDQVLVGQEFPGPGMTVSADEVFEEPGGKGLNQALAAARMGARVSFIGATGDDGAAEPVRRVLMEAGIDTSRLRRAPGSTGRAFIFVDRQRDNRIVLVPGANGSVTRLDADDRELIASADALLLQLELPQSVAADAAAVAARAGVSVGLTPAPVQPLDPELLAATSIVFANQLEVLALTGRDDLDEAIDDLLEQVPALLLTRGALGSDYADRGGARVHRDALPVAPVDTTAAGDVYAGVYSVARAGGASIEEAMRRATAAAAIAVQRRGTSSAIPTAQEVLAVGTERRS